MTPRDDRFHPRVLQQAAPLAAILVLGISGCLGDDNGGPAQGDDAGLGTDVRGFPQAALTHGPEDANGSMDAWVLHQSLRMGWVAAAGTHTFLGETQVGLTNSDGQCPNFGFFVPDAATKVEIRIDAGLVNESSPGAGAYNIAIGDPESVSYFESIQGPIDHSVDDPVVGVWTVEFHPQGAAANLAFPVEVRIEGGGPAPSDGIQGKLDSDCLP